MEHTDRDADVLAGDLVSGVDEIAKLIGESERRTHYLLTKGRLPGAFKMGGRWYALRSEMAAGLRRMARGEAA